MAFVRVILAYGAAVVTTLVLAAAFYTQQVSAKQVEFGAVFTPADYFETYIQNLVGLAPAFGAVIAIGLLIAFPVAAAVKRILKPLAPIAYPVAGATAMATAIWAIENLVIGGGVGVIGGARGPVGLGLQALAGALGGVVFTLIAVRKAP